MYVKKSKAKFDVKYAWRMISKPIGVNVFLFKELPNSIKSELSTIEEIEQELLDKKKGKN